MILSLLPAPFRLHSPDVISGSSPVSHLPPPFFCLPLAGNWKCSACATFNMSTATACTSCTLLRSESVDTSGFGYTPDGTIQGAEYVHACVCVCWLVDADVDACVCAAAFGFYVLLVSFVCSIRWLLFQRSIRLYKCNDRSDSKG